MQGNIPVVMQRFDELCAASEWNLGHWQMRFWLPAIGLSPLPEILTRINAPAIGPQYAPG
jgi:hypothetical protein